MISFPVVATNMALHRAGALRWEKEGIPAVLVMTPFFFIAGASRLFC
jgi:hypothetical protein